MAFSLEINRFVDAIEANELWMEGELKDKKAFICVGENCYAGITCKNMDTFASDRKWIPHFIMSQHENRHSDSCEVFREFLKKDLYRNYINKEGNTDNVGDILNNLFGEGGSATGYGNGQGMKW